MDTDRDVREELRYPDIAGYPDGMGFLDQGTASLVDLLLSAVGIDEPSDEQEHEIAVDRIDAERLYAATISGRRLGWIRFEQAGTRVTLASTTIEPAFRGRGFAADLIADVLDRIRDRGETLTVACSTIATFLETHKEYWELLDPGVPGAGLAWRDLEVP